MTREEFNKLPKQERIDLAFDRCKIIWSMSGDNPTRNITHIYARLNKNEEWKLVRIDSCQSDWFGLTAESFLGKGYRSMTFAFENNRKCFVKKITQNGAIIINNDNIPDGFLESIMFDEIPNGEISEEYLDKFDSLAYLHPRAVYSLSKQIHMEMDEYIKKSREHGEWLKPKVISCVSIPVYLTKINIAIISIMILITITSIICVI